MNGRDFFKRFSFVTDFSAKFFKVVPRSVSDFIWDLTFPFGGKFAAFTRYSILSGRLKKHGLNIYVGRAAVLKNMESMSIGDNVSIHESCYIDAAGGLEIGNDVSIAHHTSILTFDHTWSDPLQPIKYNPIRKSQVIIHDDVWIGCGVRIMSGVVIGTRSVVAAGSVVTHDVPPGMIVAGVPAKIIKSVA